MNSRSRVRLRFLAMLGFALLVPRLAGGAGLDLATGGPGKALATLLLDGVQLTVAGAQAALGALRGQCWVVMFADAFAAPQDFSADANPVLAFDTALSTSFFGTASASGLSVCPAGPFVPVATSTGFSASRSIAGAGALSVPSGPLTPALLAHLGVMALDPTPSPGVAFAPVVPDAPPASAVLRAYLRLPDGREEEFWRATVSLAPDPADGDLVLTVEDPAGLLRAGMFETYELPDESRGFLLADPAGVDLVIPLPPLDNLVGRPVEIALEGIVEVSSTAKPPLDQVVGPVAAGVEEILGRGEEDPLPLELVLSLKRSLVLLETGVGDEVAEELERGRVEAMRAARPDLARALTHLRRLLTGMTLVLPDLPFGAVADGDTTDRLNPLRFQVLGTDRAGELSFELAVNGRAPDVLLPSVEPPGPGSLISGSVTWSFHDGEDAAHNLPKHFRKLGLGLGQNQLVLCARELSEAGGTVCASSFLYVPVPAPGPEDG